MNDFDILPDRHDIDVDLLDAAHAPEEKPSLTKTELLTKLLESFQDYRIKKQLPNFATFRIHLQVLTHKILLGSFDTVRGFSSDSEWSKYYGRIKYTLTGFVELEDNEFYITPIVEKTIQSYLDGANSNHSEPPTNEPNNSSDAKKLAKAKKLSEFYIDLNFTDYVVESQVTVYHCKICDKELQQYELVPHMKKHTLAEFMQEGEK